MTNALAEWIAVAVAITPGFETSGDPYVAAAGDFDGMGISCGAPQWNIGKNSLQPMIKAVGKQTVVTAMPTFGAELWSAANSTVSKALHTVRGWQTGTTLKAKPKSELSRFMGTVAMRNQQQNRIDAVADIAFARAEEWSKALRHNNVSKRMFCWFFDLVTQNGGMKGITPGVVVDFIKTNKPDNVDDLICDYLASRKGISHAADARKNGALWRAPSDQEKLELLCMSYLRSGSSIPQWRHVVLNRKGTIAIGNGWVNSSHWDFTKFGL